MVGYSGGRTFRLTIKTDAPQSDFEALESGEKTLEQMSAQYWNGKKDCYYIGLTDTDPDGDPAIGETCWRR